MPTSLKAFLIYMHIIAWVSQVKTQIKIYFYILDEVDNTILITSSENDMEVKKSNTTAVSKNNAFSY